ncbi:MAG: nucleotidyltransferase family protein [Chloroflexi bacterium]|nr:nucleotidyltransferase family protein [Chloroflexota bacterium]
MDKQPSVVAIVTAGWSPKEDNPLAEYTRDKPKALIPIAGKPMIAHVVDALAGSRNIQNIVVVSLDPAAGVQFSVPVEYVPDAGDILDNAEAGMNYVAAHYPDADAAILSSSDIPTITPPIVDAFIEECFRTDHDLYYSIIERSVMESRFPGSLRSYIHVREGDFAGGDLMLVRPGMALDQREMWRALSAARKNSLRQARLVGLGVFLKLITRRLSLDDGERRISKVLNVRIHALPFPYAEVGMDVDKPFQLEIVRAEMEARAASGA